MPPEAIIHEKSNAATFKAVSGDELGPITRKIISLFITGYNSIFIKTDKQFSAKQRQDIKNVVRRMLVGTEIVIDTPNQLMLQVLVSYQDFTIQNTLRRMSIITRSMHNDVVATIENNDIQAANEIISTDNEVDRFNIYIARLLRIAIQNPKISKEIGLLNAKDCLGYLVVTRLVERTADHAASIAKNALAINRKLNEDIIEVIEHLSNVTTAMFDQSMEALFRRDYNLAENIIEQLHEIEVLERQAIEICQLDVENFASLRLIIESIRRTAEYSCDIAEVVLNLTIDSITV